MRAAAWMRHVPPVMSLAAPQAPGVTLPQLGAAFARWVRGFLFRDGDAAAEKLPMAEAARPKSAGASPVFDLAEAYDRHAGMLARRIGRFYRGAEAEDVLQEVFLAALESIHGFRGECALSTWLYRLATNYCLNRLRLDRRRGELLLAHEGALAPGGAEGTSPESTADLRTLWRKLPEELLVVAVYYHVDGMTHAEIARIMNVSRRAIGYRLKALEKALASLEAGGADAG